MSTPQPPRPAKLIVGLFTRKAEWMSEAAQRLLDCFGPIDLVSPLYPFDFTNYYEKEMGTPLFRRLIVFKNLIRQEDLTDIKLKTNAIERDFAEDDNRQINIDPGYLLMERLVLATGKNYSHRIHIGGGIYADLTLIYQHNGYQPLPWTYPDYAHPSIRDFLGLVRNKYQRDLKETAS